MDVLLICVVIALIASALGGIVGSYVSAAKGRGGTEGAILGVALGPIGALVAALLPNREVPAVPPSHEELEEVQADARAVRYLGGITPARGPDLNVFDQMGGSRLTPEERARRDEKGIGVLRAKVRTDNPNALQP